MIRKALVGVNIEGTSAAAFRGAGYTSGGKTGTAQVIAIKQGEKYNAVADSTSATATTRCSWPTRRPKIRRSPSR